MADDAPRVTADELQARLALRSLCSRSFGTSRPGKAGAASGDAESKASAEHADADHAASKADADHDDAPHGFSLFQKRLMGEMEEVLRSGLARRMERLTSQLHGLSGSGHGAAKPTGDSEAAAEDPNLKPLAIAMAKAMKGAEEFIKKPDLAYGPSFRQRRFDDPPDQNTVAFIREIPAMNTTLTNVQQTIAKRERQIISLKAQVETCESLAEEQGQKSAVVGSSPESHEEFLDPAKVDTSKLVKMHEEIVERRRKAVAELSKELVLAKAQSAYYQGLHRQQQKYIQSIDQPTVHYHIFRETGGSFMQHLTSPSTLFPGQNPRSELYSPRLARHPAGEVFVSPPPPPPMNDDRPVIWDIGCAIANPYVTDSWPFEPNVQAQRSPEEAFMPKLEEETQEDIDEENRPGPRNPFRGLAGRMPRGSGSDDEMPSTSRSL